MTKGKQKIISLRHHYIVVPYVLGVRVFIALETAGNSQSFLVDQLSPCLSLKSIR